MVYSTILCVRNYMHVYDGRVHSIESAVSPLWCIMFEINNNSCLLHQHIFSMDFFHASLRSMRIYSMFILRFFCSFSEIGFTHASHKCNREISDSLMEEIVLSFSFLSSSNVPHFHNETLFRLIQHKMNEKHGAGDNTIRMMMESILHNQLNVENENGNFQFFV